MSSAEYPLLTGGGRGYLRVDTLVRSHRSLVQGGMVVDTVISTTAGSPARRVAAWNEAACKYLTPMSVQPFDAAGFRGHMRRAELEDVRAVDIHCLGARVQRSAVHVARTREPVFTLDVQLKGESVVRQAGREARLAPGDFVLTDSTRPYQVVFERPVVMRLLRVPAAMLKRFVGCPEEVVGIRVDGSKGTGRIASSFVQALWRDDEDFTALAGASHVERAALELLASAYSQFRSARANRSSLATMHRMRIVELIEKDLHDATLSPSTIASALRITPRYLHRVFSSDGETVSRYILRRRLERSAEQLLDPLHSGRHVSELAFGCGFSNVSHFCRVFREQFGISPGDFRERRPVAA